jgi:hypothetical protein
MGADEMTTTPDNDGFIGDPVNTDPQSKNSKGKEVCAIFEKMKQLRYPLDKAWERAYRYSFPFYGQGFNWRQETMNTLQQGRVADVWQDDMMTTEGPDTCRLLASAILSSLTPTNVRWFDLDVAGMDYDGLSQASKAWLEDSANVVCDEINKANYDAESMDFAIHLVVAGMGGLFIDWRDDLQTPGLFFEASPISNLYFQEVLGSGFIDTVYMSLRRTVIRLVNEYGYDNLPRFMQEEYDKNPYSEKEHNIIWVIRPRLKNGKQSKGKMKRNLPWESLVVAKEGGHCIYEGGYHEFPTIAPRWAKIPGSPYARGPFYTALPTILTLNEVWRLKFDNADLICAGAWKATDDGILNPSTLRIEGRVVIPVADMNNLEKLDVGGDLQLTDRIIEMLNMDIRKIMMADQLSPSEKTIQTAAEVQARANQVRQVLGPVFARLQREFIAPLVERCFALCLRNKKLPPVPSELDKPNVMIKTGFKSPLARAQKLNELNAIDQTMTRIDNLAQADPGVLDNFDFDKIAREVADLNDLDPDLMLDMKDVEGLRLKRQQMQAAQAQQQAAMQGQGPNVPQNAPNPSLPQASPQTPSF